MTLRRGSQARNERSDISLCRAAHRCVAAHVIPSLTLRVHPFFCCERAQVKHSLFATVILGSRTTIHSVSLRLQFDASCVAFDAIAAVVVDALGDMSHGIVRSPTQTSVHGTRHSYACRHAIRAFDAALRMSSTVSRATASMLEPAPTAGCGPVRSVRRWCSARRGLGRHRPWSSPIFWCPTVRSSRPRPSPTSCGRRHRRATAKGGRSSTTRAVKSSVRPVSSASAGHH